MKITQIFVDIWTHLFLRISLEITKLRYRHDYYFCILGDVDLNYHPTMFGSNCKRQCGYMDKTVKTTVKTTVNCRSETCLKFKDGFRRRISSLNVITEKRYLL